MVDADWKPSMGFLHGELKKAQQEIKEALNNQKIFYEPVMKIIRMKMSGRLDSSLHLAAYLLNPYYLYNDMDIQYDEKVNEAVNDVVETLYPQDLDMQQKILLEELPVYTCRSESFAKLLALKSCEVNTEKYDPANWWTRFGSSAPHLRKIAIRILSLTTSSSGCERNWSTFEAIHTKKRNRLEASKLNNLVFVQFNANLILKNKKRKERGHEVLLTDDTSEAQEWFIDDDVVDAISKPKRSARRQFLEDDFESEDEEMEIDAEDVEYGFYGDQIIEQNGQDQDLDENEVDGVLDNLILETLNKLMEPGGSNKTTIL
ncbi:uncharacterized protein [Rutidosis leptorrhynchoides]|uniref:uncharacterized protein n=1 Tax=Rutidosis leptorrhynchoides TaxID=125765 RepID=UPI003A9A4389